MVNVTKGILVECDPAMKQVLPSIHRDFTPICYISVSSASWWEVHSWLKIYHPGDKFYFLSIAKKTFVFRILTRPTCSSLPTCWNNLKLRSMTWWTRYRCPLLRAWRRSENWKEMGNWDLLLAEDIEVILRVIAESELCRNDSKNSDPYRTEDWGYIRVMFSFATSPNILLTSSN